MIRSISCASPAAAFVPGFKGVLRRFYFSKVTASANAVAVDCSRTVEIQSTTLPPSQVINGTVSEVGFFHTEIGIPFIGLVQIDLTEKIDENTAIRVDTNAAAGELSDLVFVFDV